MCETLEEKSVVLEKSVDIFVDIHCNNWNEMEKFQLKPLELLQQGGERTLEHLCWLLGNCRDRIHDENILTAVIAKLKQFPKHYASLYIGTYASKHLTIEEQNNLSVEMISGGNENVLLGLLNSRVQLPLNLVIRFIIPTSIHDDDDWIRTLYLDTFNLTLNYSEIIMYALDQPNSYVNEIVNELLRMNKEISGKNPRYRNNSKQHRIKFCIAHALVGLAGKYTCSDMLWSALFSSTDQFNIILMYEILVARSISRPDGLLERLQSIASLEPDHQMSLLSITNIFIHLKWSLLKEDQIQNMINSLLPLTVEAVLQVGQFALLIVNEVIKKSKDEGLKIPIVNTLPSSTAVNLAEISVGTQLEVRLLLPELDWTTGHPWTWYMSNVKPRFWSDGKLLQAKKIRKATKLSSIEIQPINTNETIFTSKIDIYPKSDLDSPNISANKADLIVVAVLMDERTNLNDLLQTCRALGVRSLIVSDSSNLSEGSEDTLNIVKLKPELLSKYLREKKLENYNIVATRKTSPNADYVNFTFAKRTILLLGVS
ncbi:uncharacterized protein [Drosophila tropicalis]|uniref:uncharacterized protein n=1 Tax=Drosophila tropicalis TaxID=46794 RepID=UPI0035AB96AB